MVYVDNVVEALVCALFADAHKVNGQIFNLGEADHSTWREFYQYFANAHGLDLTRALVSSPCDDKGSSVPRILAWLMACGSGMRQILTSKELKTFGARVLQTNPIGRVPRQIFERFPSLERRVRSMIGADDRLPVYYPEQPAQHDTVYMGSGGAVLSIEKLDRVLGFQPPVPRERAMELTLDWVRYARIVGE